MNLRLYLYTMPLFPRPCFLSIEISLKNLLFLQWQYDSGTKVYTFFNLYTPDVTFVHVCGHVCSVDREQPRVPSLKTQYTSLESGPLITVECTNYT